MKKEIFFIGLLVVVGSNAIAQTILGIDVSHYQGTINWTQVSAAGKIFAYIKATEGVSYTDPTYTTYLANGSSAGVIMGSYHFARPETNTAVDEANYYLSVAGSSIGTNRLPPALDLEDPPTGAGLTSYFTSAQLTTWAQTWMTTVYNATGIQPVIYTSASIAAYLNSSLNNYKLWIANPGTSSGTPPSNIGVWTTWAFKQYSWTGTVSGISGSVDLDVYNGTVADFNNLIGTVPCTAPSNDNCPGTPITSNGACLSGTVSCATSSYGANQCAGCTCTSPDDRDVYYSFTAVATSETVTLSNYANDFDAVMELRTACAYNTALGCYDPSGVPASVSNTWNNLTIGNTYYIRIFEYNYSGSAPSSPTFDICVTHTVCTPPTNISFSGTLSACASATTNVSVSASNCSGCTFAWSVGMVSGSSKNLLPGTYSVTATNSCGGTAAGSVTVSTLTNPTANIFPLSIFICNGTSTTLTASGGGTYAWSNSLGTNAQVSVSPTNLITYTVTVTNANNCTATANSIVTVNQNPTANISPSSVSICNGTSTTLTASGGGTYAWSNALGTNAQVSVSPTNLTTYTVTVTNANNCTATANSVVTVNQNPSANVSPSSISICNGTSTTLTASGGGNYAWSNSLGSSAQVSVSPTNAATYSVTVTDGNNCSATASASVNVNTTPDAPTFTPTSGCNPVTVMATSNNCSGCSYQWSSGSINNTDVFTSTTSYTVTATSNNNCSASANGTVTVNGQAFVSIISTDTGFCAGNSVTLSANQTASSFLWSGPNSFTSAASQITVNTAGVYSITVTDPGSCTGTVTANTTIVQYSSPVADAGTNQTNTGAGVTIGGNPTASGGQLPYTYLWNPASTLDNSTVANPLANPSGITTYILTVTDNNGCTGIDTVLVSIQIICAPVADFSAPSTAGFAPFTANFTDNSANTPTQWEWIFSGGNPPTSSVQTPTVVYNAGGIYDVSLKVTNACGSDSITKTQYINVIATGIEMVFTLQNISVFPNPNTGIFILKMETESNQNIKLNLFNSLGQLVTKRDVVTTTKLTQTDFDLSANAKGIYYIQILSAGQYYYLKVLVE